MSVRGLQRFEYHLGLLQQGFGTPLDKNISGRLGPLACAAILTLAGNPGPGQVSPADIDLGLDLAEGFEALLEIPGGLVPISVGLGGMDFGQHHSGVAVF